MVPRPKFQAGSNPVSIIAGNLDLAHSQKILSFLGPTRIADNVIKEIFIRNQLAYTIWSDTHLRHCPCCTNSWFEEIVGADSLMYQHIYNENDIHSKGKGTRNIKEHIYDSEDWDHNIGENW